ncbi:MAG: hypothetical protein AB8G11_06715 [Saprospiraceae bacterium]
MKYIIFLLAMTLLFSCDNLTDRDFRKSDTYVGYIQVISKKDGVIVDETKVDIRVKLSNNTFSRLKDNGNKACFGDFDLSRNKAKFSSSECSCFCDCNPNIDCAGDFILGEYDIVFASDNKLELEVFSDFSNVESYFDESLKEIVLEKE